MFSQIRYRSLLSLLLCGVALSACQTTKSTEGSPTLGVNGKQPIEITGGIVQDVPSTPIVSNDPSVQVFPLDGPVQNPLSVEKYNGVLDNTTAGGYTVFDDSVKVYPLPGQEIPAFVPQYAVPPLEAQYKAEVPHVGQLTSLAQSSLPPVPTVDVREAQPFSSPPISGAVRQPLTLTAPEPVTMQPPASARSPMLSPFGADEDDMVADAPDITVTPRGPSLTDPYSDEPVAAPMPDDVQQTQRAPVPTGTGVTAAGRRSGPALTGY